MTERRFNPVAWATNAAVDSVDINEVLADVDVEAFLDRIDVNELLERADVNRILDRVDTNRLLDRVDTNRLLDHVDTNRLLDHVDTNRLLDNVDVDRLLSRVDVDALLDKADVNRLLARVDPNELIARVDLNAALANVDLDEVMDRVDVKRLVDRAGVPELVQQSTGHMAGSLMDVARRQVVSVDQIVVRITGRLVGRKTNPGGPPLLVARQESTTDEELDKGVVTGHYAGPVSRLIAFGMDAALVFGTFTLLSAGVLYLLNLFLADTEQASFQSIVGIVLLLTWAFLYSVLALAIAGRTIGKGIVGLRVVKRQGNPVSLGQAVVRTLVMPFSFLFLGLGFLGVLFGKNRRALHDIVAGTCVVYDWGDRPAELPAPLTKWLNNRAK